MLEGVGCQEAAMSLSNARRGNQVVYRPHCELQEAASLFSQVPCSRGKLSHLLGQVSDLARTHEGMEPLLHGRVPIAPRTVRESDYLLELYQYGRLAWQLHIRLETRGCCASTVLPPSSSYVTRDCPVEGPRSPCLELDCQDCHSDLDTCTCTCAPRPLVDIVL